MTQHTTSQDGSAISYTIDRNDLIINITESWDRFALENEASHLHRSQVLHRPLWDFIADVETRHVHRVLLERIRNKQVPLEFPFRCDSPSIRRYMRMQITPAPEESIIYTCTVDRIEHRAPVLFAEQKGWRETKLLRMCSWCKKVDVGGDVWMEIEPAIQHLQLLERKLLPEISHTMCDECLNTLDDSTS